MDKSEICPRIRALWDVPEQDADLLDVGRWSISTPYRHWRDHQLASFPARLTAAEQAWISATRSIAVAQIPPVSERCTWRKLPWMCGLPVGHDGEHRFGRLEAEERIAIFMALPEGTRAHQLGIAAYSHFR